MVRIEASIESKIWKYIWCFGCNYVQDDEPFLVHGKKNYTLSLMEFEGTPRLLFQPAKVIANVGR
jgi:hypothetical protein